MILRKVTYLFFLLALFVQCEQKELETEKTTDVSDEIKNENYILNNPVLFMGSSFGEFFQTLHQLGKYENMFIYTSQKTKEKFTKPELIDFYKNMKFSYPLQLKAFKSDDENVLMYETQIQATTKTIQFQFRVENDTCRAYFNSLKPGQPFIGL